jgi:TrkA domain protein
MAVVEETVLPGVGVRFEFETSAGERVAVLLHRSGRRELMVYDREDPDTCRTLLRLAEEDARVLVDLLGGSEVTERLEAALRQSVEGLTIEWVEIPPGSPVSGRTLADLGLRTRTGVSIVAVIRAGRTFASPRAEFELEAGDTAVLVGSPEAIGDGAAALRGG